MEVTLEVEPLRFVQSKVTDAQLFFPWRRSLGADSKKPWLLCSMAAIGAPPDDSPEMTFLAVNTEKVSSTQAVAGTSQPTNHAILGIKLNDVPKSRRSSLADGWRGCQECSCVSSEFISFINRSFQLEFDLLQTVTIPARGGVQ
jgi:hypothetical protein